MSDAIRVLHVDDEPDFAELTASQLERVDEISRVDVATTADDGFELLAENGYDCVVSDYDMPKTDGLEFLEQVRRTYPDLPFILFTGKGSEMVASEAISSGVTDYLHKESGSSHYELLANRIANAVGQYRSQRELEKEHQRFSLLFENFPEPTIATEFEDGEPILYSVNDAFADTFGIAKKEAVGRSVDDLIVPQERMDEATDIDQRVQNGEIVDIQVRRRASSGDRYFNLRSIPIPLEEGPDAFAVYNDITELKERELHLESERDRLSTLLENLPNPVVHGHMHTGEPIVLDVNPAFEETFGYDAGEVVGEPLDEFTVPEHDQPDADRWNDQLLETGRIQAEVTRRTTDGFRDFLLNVVLRDSNGDAIEGYAIYTDITERKERERKFRELERFSRELAEHAPVGLFRLDEDMRITYENPRAEEIVGVPEDETHSAAIGRDPRGLPSIREAGAVDIFDRLATGESVEFELPFESIYGEQSYLSGRGVPLTEDGSFQGAILMVEDITERRERTERFKTLHEVVTDLAACETEEAVCERTVTAAEEVLELYLCYVGLREGDTIVPKATSDQAGQDYVREMRIDQGVAGKTIRTGESFLLDDVATEQDADPVRDDYRSAISVPIGDIGVLQAVSDEESGFTEADLELAETLAVHAAESITRIRSMASLERQNERLEQFTTIVSHDLRNPLNVASGRFELVTEECDSQHLEPLGEALDRMSTLIEDTLTLASQGQTVAKSTPIELEELVTQCWNVVSTEDATLEATGTIAIRGDADRIRHVMENLFRNAVDHGGTDVTIRVGPIDDGGFFVEDDGPGIPADHRDRVFEVGYSTERHGTGFGLAIVREIIEAHGWEIRATEAEGGGARFEVTGVDIVG